MKRIAAIGSLDAFPYLLAGCFGTLSRYSRHGDETYVLITLDARPDRIDPQKSWLESIERAAKCVNISKVLFIEGFDHDTVSQNNVNLLRSCIESIGPTLVLMPLRKATNSRQGVLGSCAFLACRWIANILLYKMDRNPNFAPTVFSNLSDYEKTAKQRSIQEFTRGDDNNHLLTKPGETPQLLYDKMDAKHSEMFESHRLVLLSANDVV